MTEQTGAQTGEPTDDDVRKFTDIKAHINVFVYVATVAVAWSGCCYGISEIIKSDERCLNGEFSEKLELAHKYLISVSVFLTALLITANCKAHNDLGDAVDDHWNNVARIIFLAGKQSDGENIKQWVRFNHNAFERLKNRFTPDFRTRWRYGFTFTD